MKILRGDIIFISTYNEGFFMVEEYSSGITWKCYPIEKEPHWDILYELMQNNEPINCYMLNEKYDETTKSYSTEVIL